MNSKKHQNQQQFNKRSLYFIVKAIIPIYQIIRRYDTFSIMSFSYDIARINKISYNKARHKKYESIVKYRVMVKFLVLIWIVMLGWAGGAFCLQQSQIQLLGSKSIILTFMTHKMLLNFVNNYKFYHDITWILMLYTYAIPILYIIEFIKIKHFIHMPKISIKRNKNKISIKRNKNKYITGHYKYCVYGFVSIYLFNNPDNIIFIGAIRVPGYKPPLEHCTIDYTFKKSRSGYVPVPTATKKDD